VDHARPPGSCGPRGLSLGTAHGDLSYAVHAAIVEVDTVPAD
jgi:hypothetical protein